MNPNIVLLVGGFNKACWINLVNAVKESGEQCKKPEALKTWQGAKDGGDSYLNAQLYFKASLQELHLSLHQPHTLLYQTVVDHLDQFSKLKKLHLSYSDRHVIPELERMLIQCQHLESIDIQATRGKRHRISKEDLKQWMMSNVQQSSSLQSIDISHNHRPQMIEYLMFKYPTVRNVTLSTAFTDNIQNFDRMLDAIKNVNHVELDYWLMDNPAEVELVLSTIKSRHNVVIIRPGDSEDSEGYSVQLSAKKYLDRNTTHCQINILETEFAAMLDSIIKNMASFPNLKVDYMDRDSLFIDVETTHQGATMFTRLIDIMSIAMDVCFTCTYIPYPSVFDGTLLFEQLEALKICAAVIDQKVLTLISRAAPKLKNLTFSSCILYPTHSQHYIIDMPHTSFDTLSIISGRSIWESYDDMNDTRREYIPLTRALKKINSKVGIEQDQMIFLKITTLSSNQVKHYTLKPGDPVVIKAISKNDYSTYAPGWPNVTIVCKSLETLKLDLGALLVELKPGIDRPMEDIDNWKQTMEDALLKELYSSERALESWEIM